MTRSKIPAVLILALLALTPLYTASAAPTAVPVIGTITSGGTGTFNGQFNINRFALQNGKVSAIGTLIGTVTNTATGATSGVFSAVSAVLSPSSSASCTILHLDLGPINLNLLGLVITTNEIILDITAVPGPGNLLGNLLCDIANLLNSPNQTLITTLNNLLGILKLL